MSAKAKSSYGVKFREKLDLDINKTILVIGEIIEIFCDKSLISTDGKIDIEQAESVAVSGLDEYHTTNSLGRLPYAKP